MVDGIIESARCSDLSSLRWRGVREFSFSHPPRRREAPMMTVALTKPEAYKRHDRAGMVLL